LTAANRSEFGKAMHEEEIASLEQTIGRRIPEPYRVFLSQHGAGRPSKNIHPPANSEIPALRDGFEVDSFLGSASRESLPASLKQLEEADGTETLFPVVELIGGDLVCLDVSDPGNGLVYWDHEESDPEVAKVALGETLAEFLDRLHG
jgi:hypothetical protein